MMTTQLFRLLGDENRFQILKFIGVGEKSVGEIVDSLQIEQSLVSHHLRKLRRDGIVRCRVDGKRRMYSVSHPGILELVEKSSEVMKKIAEKPLGVVGREKVEAKIYDSKPKSREDVLKVVSEFEREFTILFGEKFARKIAEEMRRELKRR